MNTDPKLVYRTIEDLSKKSSEEVEDPPEYKIVDVWSIVSAPIYITAIS